MRHMTGQVHSEEPFKRIPVREEQWIAAKSSLVELIEELSGSVGDGESRLVMPSLVRDLSIVEWFDCVDADRVRQLRKIVEQALSSESGESVAELAMTLHGRIEQLSNENYSSDPWQELFNVARDDLTDKAGSVVSSRLLAHYYQRPRDLAEAAGVLLYLAGRPMTISVSLGATFVSVLESPNPLWTIRAMGLIQAHLHGIGRELATRKVGTYYERSDPAWTSSRTFNAMSTLADSTEDLRTRTALHLDGYRRLAEGQLRGWLWLLIADPLEPEKPPMLGRLYERLLRDPRALLRAARHFCKPTWRNAAAHEDLAFDSQDRYVEDDGNVVDLGTILRRIGDSLAFLAGCEAGLANYPLDETEVLDVSSVGSVPLSFQILRTREWFGDNGLLVKSVDHKNGRLLISVEEIGLNQVDPCFQALVECLVSGVEFEEAEVWLGDRAAGEGSGPALLVSVRSTRAALETWRQVRKLRFFTNPGSTFLPMQFDNRRRAEDERLAFDAVAWLALNDCLHAYDVAFDALQGLETADDRSLARMRQAEAPTSREVQVQKYLLRRLKVARAGLAHTHPLLGAQPTSYAVRAKEAVERQLSSAARALRVANSTFSYPDWLLELRDSSTPPAPAPTLGLMEWG